VSGSSAMNDRGGRPPDESWSKLWNEWMKDNGPGFTVARPTVLRGQWVVGRALETRANSGAGWVLQDRVLPFWRRNDKSLAHSLATEQGCTGDSKTAIVSECIFAGESTYCMRKCRPTTEANLVGGQSRLFGSDSRLLTVLAAMGQRRPF
jgi:hypothetical protein